MTKPITWVDLKGPDEFDHTHWDTLGEEADALFDLLNVEHDESNGEHDTQKVSRGWGSFASNGATLQRFGLVSSVTRVSTGLYTVNLSANLAQVSAAYWYQVLASIPAGPAGGYEYGFIREKTASRAAGSYQLETFDEFGNVADRRLFTEVHGVLA